MQSLNLRGGGCSSAKINIIQPIIKQPSNIVENIKYYTKIIVDKANLVYDKNHFQDVLIAIQWFIYHKEQLDSLCQNENTIQQSYLIILDSIQQLLKNSLIYIRTNKFLLLQILQIGNDLLRIIFLFLLFKQESYLDDQIKIQLLDNIAEISQENDQIWQIGFEYEIQIMKSCLENCRSNSTKGQEILQDFVVGLIKSAITMSPNGDLLKSIFEGAQFLTSILYNEIENNVKKFEIHSYFETLKWMIIRNLTDNSVTLSYLKSLLIDCFENYVQNSSNWIIHFCWQRMITDILSYRPIIKKEQFKSIQNWNQLISQKIIIPMSYNKLEAKICDIQNFSYDSFEIELIETYNKLIIFQQQLLEDKLIKGQTIFNYYIQFQLQNQQTYNYEQTFQKKFILYNILLILWKKFINLQEKINQQDKLSNEMLKFHRQQDCNEIQNVLKQLLIIILEIQFQMNIDNQKCQQLIIQQNESNNNLQFQEKNKYQQQFDEVIEIIFEQINLCILYYQKQQLYLTNQQIVQNNLNEAIRKFQSHYQYLSNYHHQVIKLKIYENINKTSSKFSIADTQIKLNLLVNKKISIILLSQQSIDLNSIKILEQNTQLFINLLTLKLVTQLKQNQLKRIEFAYQNLLTQRLNVQNQNVKDKNLQFMMNLFQNQLNCFKQNQIRRSKNEQTSYNQVQKLLQNDLNLIKDMNQQEEYTYFILQIQSKLMMLEISNENVIENENEILNTYEIKIKLLKEDIQKTQSNNILQNSDIPMETLIQYIESHQDLINKLQNLIEQFTQFNTLIQQSENLQNNNKQIIINSELIQTYQKKIYKIINQFKDFQETGFEIQINMEDIKLEQYFEFLDQCQDFDKQLDYQANEIYQTFQENMFKVEKSHIWEDNSYKVREGVFMNLIKMQSLRSDETMQRFCQKAIQQMWIKEKDVRVRVLMKNQELIEIQQKLYSQNLTTFQNTIKEEVNLIIDQIKQLEIDIQLEIDKDIKLQLLQKLQQKNEELDDYISGISEMSQKLDISLIFLKEIQKQLQVINQKINVIKQSIDSIDQNVQKLVGKHWTELIQFRKQKILKQMEWQQISEIYVPISVKKEDNTVQLDEVIESFLTSTYDVMLISGECGSGKSTAAQKIEEFICKSEQQWITLFIKLNTINNPKINLFDKILESEQYQFDKLQIREMKQDLFKYKLLLILDNYDEMINYVNLYQSNDLSQLSQNIKIIITVRKEILNQMGYQSWFYGKSLKSLQEIELIQLTNIKEFIQQYCIQQIQIRLIEISDNKEDFIKIWKNILPIIQQKVDQNKSETFLTVQDISRIFYHLQCFPQFKQINNYSRLEQNLLSIPNQNKILKELNSLDIKNILSTPFMVLAVLQMISKLEPINFHQQFIQKYIYFKKIQLEFEAKIQENNYIKIDEEILQQEAQQKLKIYFNQNENLQIKNNIDQFTLQIVSTIKNIELTIYDCYDAFIDHYHEQQLLNKRKKINDIQNIMVDLKQFQQCLAWDMTIRDLSKLEYKVKGYLKYKKEEDWMDKYFEESDYKLMIINCSLIIKNGSTYFFKHKQIQDFYVAKVILEELLSKQVTLLNQQNISLDNYQGAILILKQKIQKIENLRQQLIQNILSSQNNIQFKRLASNSLFLLSVMNEFLGDLQLQNIIISDTNLCGLNFFGSNLSNSKFENVLIDSCNFNNAILKNVSWLNIQCKEKPFLQGHQDYIRQIDFSIDRIHLVSAGDDNNIKIWNIQQYSLEKTLEGHTDIVQTVQYFPDGKTLASGGNDKIIRVWNSENGKLIYQLEGHSDNVTTIVINNSVLISGSNDKTIIIWSIQSQKIINILQQDNIVTKIQFYNNGKELISFGESFIIWDIVNYQQLKIINKYQQISTFTVNSKYIAIGQKDGTIMIIENEQLFEGHKRLVNCLSFSRNDQLLASGSEDQTVRLWEVKNGNQIAIFEGHSHFITSVIFSQDDKTIFSSSYDKLIRQWNVGVTKYSSLQQDGHQKYISNVKFSKDGKILASSSLDGTIKLWDFQNYKLIKTLYGHNDMIWGLTFSPIQMILASCSDDNTIIFWDLIFYNQIRVLNTDSMQITYSNDGKLFATGGIEQCVRLWNALNYELIKEFNVHSDTITQLLFYQDNLISSSKDTTINIININTLQQKQVLKYHKSIITNILIQDNILYSIGYDGKIRLYDLNENKLINQIDGHNNTITSILFNNNIIYTGGDDNLLKIWDSQNFELIKSIQLSDQIKCLSLYNNIIAIGCYDGSIHLLDIQKIIIIKIFAKQCLLQANNCQIQNSLLQIQNESLQYLFIQKGAQIIE